MEETESPIGELELAGAFAGAEGELRRIRRFLTRPRVLRERVRITATQNPVDLLGDERFPFYSVLVENPTAVTVELGFGARQGTPAIADARVPATSWRLIPIRFEVVSLGVAAGSEGGADGRELFVVRFDRLLPAASGSYAP